MVLRHYKELSETGLLFLNESTGMTEKEVSGSSFLSVTTASYEINCLINCIILGDSRRDISVEREVSIRVLPQPPVPNAAAE